MIFMNGGGRLMALAREIDRPAEFLRSSSQ